MGYLTKPYRIFYVSKSYVSGLTNIAGFVMKPNGALAGAYAMTEGTGPFLGVYHFDFNSSAFDPEGEYLAIVVSPSEGLRDVKRFGLYQMSSGSGGVEPDGDESASVPVLAASQSLVAHITAPNLVGFLGAPGELTGQVGAETLVGETAPTPELEALLDTTKEIDGHV